MRPLSDEGPAQISLQPGRAFRRFDVRRAYDEMELLRLGGVVGFIRELTPPDGGKWPFVAVYALRATRLACSDRRSIDMSAGDCCILRTRANLVVSAAHQTDLLIVYAPAAAIGPYQRCLDEADGRSYSTAGGTAHLVGELLRGLSRQLESYQCPNPARLSHHVVGLLALMCTEASGPEVGLTKRRLLVQAKEFIENNLSDVHLTPDRIAAAQHVSLRTLHRLFESDGSTISGWIRGRRLEHCRLDLADAALADVPVSHIGSRWGLWDAAHFSRLFKAAYGLSPRAYRLAHGGPTRSQVRIPALSTSAR